MTDRYAIEYEVGDLLFEFTTAAGFKGMVALLVEIWAWIVPGTGTDPARERIPPRWWRSADGDLQSDGHRIT